MEESVVVIEEDKVKIQIESVEPIILRPEDIQAEVEIEFEEVNQLRDDEQYEKLDQQDVNHLKEALAAIEGGMQQNKAAWKYNVHNKILRKYRVSIHVWGMYYLYLVCDAIKQHESDFKKDINTYFCFIVSLVS